MPLSKWEKLLCGAYVILKDYSLGSFPPKFEDQAAAYQNEINFSVSLPGYSVSQVQKDQVTKPFWGPLGAAKYLNEFNRLYSLLYEHGLKPGARLLELGCGSGWMAELFALAGYAVLGTTISPREVALGEQKAAGLKCKELPGELSFNLKFLVCPMESIDELPECIRAFDAAYVYEALHHAFDWRKTLRATAATLKAGGSLFIANEPNRLHTCISYRVAKLSNTHEIGFSRRELCEGLKSAGFSSVRVISPRFDNWVTHHWIVARKD